MLQAARGKRLKDCQRDLNADELTASVRVLSQSPRMLLRTEISPCLFILDNQTATYQQLGAQILPEYVESNL